MATHPRRSRATRARAMTPQQEETPPRKKAGRPKGPPSTIINLRLPLALLARLDRYPGLFMRAKHVHGIHSLTSYNRTPNNPPIRSEPT
jgi:hypothetical protein